MVLIINLLHLRCVLYDTDLPLLTSKFQSLYNSVWSKFITCIPKARLYEITIRLFANLRLLHTHFTTSKIM